MLLYIKGFRSNLRQKHLGIYLSFSNRSLPLTREFYNVGKKNELTFHLRILQYSKVIYFVSCCQNYLETEYGTQR